MQVMKLMDIPSITVTDVARRLNRTTGRIRQICIQHGIGTLVGGRVRVFTPREVDKIALIVFHDKRKKDGIQVDDSVTRR